MWIKIVRLQDLRLQIRSTHCCLPTPLGLWPCWRPIHPAWLCCQHLGLLRFPSCWGCGSSVISSPCVVSCCLFGYGCRLLTTTILRRHQRVSHQDQKIALHGYDWLFFFSFWSQHVGLGSSNPCVSWYRHQHLLTVFQPSHRPSVTWVVGKSWLGFSSPDCGRQS